MSPSQAPQGPQGGNSTVPGASPAERQLAVRAIENVLDNWYGDGWEAMIKELKASPPEQLSQTVGRIVASSYMAQEMFAKMADKQIPQTIAMDVGRQLVEEMMRILESEQIYVPANDDEAQQFMGEALLYATELYKTTKMQTGEYDAQSAQQLSRDIQSGRYDQPTSGQGPPGTQAPQGPGDGPSAVDLYERARRAGGG